MLKFDIKYIKKEFFNIVIASICRSKLSFRFSLIAKLTLDYTIILFLWLFLDLLGMQILVNLIAWVLWIFFVITLTHFKTGMCPSDQMQRPHRFRLHKNSTVFFTDKYNWKKIEVNFFFGTYHVVAEPIYCIVNQLWSSHIACVCVCVMLFVEIARLITNCWNDIKILNLRNFNFVWKWYWNMLRYLMKIKIQVCVWIVSKLIYGSVTFLLGKVLVNDAKNDSRLINTNDWAKTKTAMLYAT